MSDESNTDEKRNGRETVSTVPGGVSPAVQMSSQVCANSEEERPGSADSGRGSATEKWRNPPRRDMVFGQVMTEMSSNDPKGVLERINSADIREIVSATLDVIARSGSWGLSGAGRSNFPNHFPPLGNPQYKCGKPGSSQSATATVDSSKPVVRKQPSQRESSAKAKKAPVGKTQAPPPKGKGKGLTTGANSSALKPRPSNVTIGEFFAKSQGTKRETPPGPSKECGSVDSSGQVTAQTTEGDKKTEVPPSDLLPNQTKVFKKVLRSLRSTRWSTPAKGKGKPLHTVFGWTDDRAKTEVFNWVKCLTEKKAAETVQNANAESTSMFILSPFPNLIIGKDWSAEVEIEEYKLSLLRATVGYREKFLRKHTSKAAPVAGFKSGQSLIDWLTSLSGGSWVHLMTGRSGKAPEKLANLLTVRAKALKELHGIIQIDVKLDEGTKYPTDPDTGEELVGFVNPAEIRACYVAFSRKEGEDGFTAIGAPRIGALEGRNDQYELPSFAGGIALNDGSVVSLRLTDQTVKEGIAVRLVDGFLRLAYYAAQIAGGTALAMGATGAVAMALTPEREVLMIEADADGTSQISIEDVTEQQAHDENVMELFDRASPHIDEV